LPGRATGGASIFGVVSARAGTHVDLHFGPFSRDLVARLDARIASAPAA
jgi:hypothetical protein